MKVLFINSVYKRGSTGKIVEQLHKYCTNNGIESYVCYGRGSKIDEKNVFKTSTEFLSKLNQIRSKMTGMVYSGNFFATNKLLRIIKRVNPDIVHIHNLNDQFVNEYRLLNFLSKHKIKTVITLHSEQMYTATCGYALECNSWREEGCKKCPHLYLSTGSKLDKTKKAFLKLKSCYDNFDSDSIGFISCTPWLQERAKQSLLCSRFKHFTVLNGADELLYKDLSSVFVNDVKTQLNLDSNKKTVLFVNPRMADPIKGYQFLEDINREYFDKYQIIVVGKVSDDIKREKEFTYLGEITNPHRLVEIYNCADYTIMLSKKECFPMVIVESLLCGTPVSLFKCEGPDNCFDNKFVKFSEYGLINSVFENLSKFECTRTKTREYAKERLSSLRMCSEYVKIYKSF